MKNFLITLIIILIPVKSFGLIEVDITRGNLNPLPIAVSPLSIDEESRKKFENILKKRNIGSEISSIVESNLKVSGLFERSGKGWSKEIFEYLLLKYSIKLIFFFLLSDVVLSVTITNDGLLDEALTSPHDPSSKENLTPFTVSILVIN